MLSWENYLLCPNYTFTFFMLRFIFYWVWEGKRENIDSLFHPFMHSLVDSPLLPHPVCWLICWQPEKTAKNFSIVLRDLKKPNWLKCSSKSTGLVYKNNMFVICNCLRVNSGIIIVLLPPQVDILRIQYLFSVKIWIPRAGYL